MKKIAVIGSHSCGKTTYAYQLATNYKHEDYSVAIITEGARKCPFELGTKEAGEWLIVNQIKEELEAQKGHQIIVCDRSTVDPVIYAEVMGVELSPLLTRLALDHLNTYDEIIVLEPSRPVVDDGFRDTNEEFRTKVYQGFKKYFPKGKKYNKETKELV